jgi:hypothetical protein
VARPRQVGGAGRRGRGARRLSRAIAAALLATALTSGVRAQSATTSADLEQTLARVGDRVEQWYARAQSIVAEERVAIQPLEYDLRPAGFPRRLAYELRLAWEPDARADALPDASVLRELLRVNGRPARPDDEPGCMDPKTVSPEPLAMLLESRRAEHRFSIAGRATVDRTAAWMIDYRGVEAGPPDIEWRDECVSVSLPGRSRGRIWVDAATYDVLRLDERLTGSFEFEVPREYVRRGAARSMVIERADTSIRYRRVQFEEPTETLLLPARIDTVTVVRGGGMQRYRITRELSDYRRFLTSGRIVIE